MAKILTNKYESYGQYQKSIELKQQQKGRKTIQREASSAVKVAFKDALVKIQRESVSING